MKNFSAFSFGKPVKQLAGNRTQIKLYYAACNVIVKCWHRDLKSAFRCHNDINWLDKFPMVLLGLRKVYKEDLKVSPAEYLYSTLLHFPGEFFTDKCPPQDRTFFLQSFKLHMQQLKPAPATQHSTNRLFVYKSLHTSLHVSRTLPKKHSLDKLILDHILRVIQKIDDRVYKIYINGDIRNISIENLKLAHMLQKDVISNPSNSQSIHSLGRTEQS